MDANTPIMERIKEYLSLGGLHNPEMMDHTKVRDLIIDCRDTITQLVLRSKMPATPREPALAAPTGETLANTLKEKWALRKAADFDRILDVLPKGPRCRDCADSDGRCMNEAEPRPPCDPVEHVIELLRSALAARVPAPSAPQEPRGEVSEAITLIATERERQKSVEGWLPEHDDEHEFDELARAAACYALPDRARDYQQHVDPAENGGRDAVWQSPDLWPFDEDFKPTPNDRIRELVKAGALVVAEIERLQRAALSSEARDASE